ncbi:hypothetical protein C9426_02940 [Serratia sp. S1B]|nr:hypothetical protein C9426_02940 [Serratia sp. S1B]
MIIVWFIFIIFEVIDVVVNHDKYQTGFWYLLNYSEPQLKMFVYAWCAIYFSAILANSYFREDVVFSEWCRNKYVVCLL